MTTSLTFDSGLLARGWLATHLATGNDEETPILYGTLYIETYATGVRLTATDRTILLSAWVPADTAATVDEPPLDEAPESTAVVRDPDGRGKALLSYLRKVAAKAAKDEIPAPLVTLNVGVAVEEGAEAGFPGMELEQVVIDYPEHERVALPIVDGTFPDYRALLARHEAKSTAHVAFGAENMTRLGQVAKVIGSFVRCSLSGPNGAVSLDCGSLPPFIRGVVMPVAVVEEARAAS